MPFVRRGDAWNARTGINLVDLVETFANANYVNRIESMIADSTIRKEALFASTELPIGAGRMELGLRRPAALRVLA
ncbi:hypothetical protein MASR1M60_32290 [Rhodocyclaceae bacterium]